MQEVLARAEGESRDLSRREGAQMRELERQAEALDARIEFKRNLAPRQIYDTAGMEDRGGGAGGECRAGRWLDAELRAIIGSSGAGAAFTPSEFAADFFDLLAAESVGLKSGFRQLRTDRDSLVVPHLTADPATAWTAEGATITGGDPNAESITATPPKLSGLTAVSNEVITDSQPALLDVLAKQLIRSLALRLDLGYFEGTGTPPEIRGLKNVSGISTVSMGTNGAALVNLDPFADAIGQLEQDNAGATAIVMHPRTWKAAIKLKEQTSGNNKPLLQESAGSAGQGIQRAIYGVPVFLSSQLSITETQGTSGAVASSAYVYEASEVVSVMREETRLELDRSRLFNSDQSEVRAILRCDVVVPNPKAIVRIVGIL